MPSIPRNPTFTQRPVLASKALLLTQQGVPALLASLLSSRQEQSMGWLKAPLRDLIPYTELKNTHQAAELLTRHIDEQSHIIIVADYDCDGATACAVAVRALASMGAKVSYVVPDRMVHGYGLTPSVVELIVERFPDAALLVTVDNGIASFDGVDAALECGIEVLITDHHLPVEGGAMPAAQCIVNPVQPECTFPSKALAGVGVIWYVMWALRDYLIHEKGRELGPETRVSNLLPFVAIGTVADVVPLDVNNRILIQGGLLRIRAGRSFPGIDALATVGFWNQTKVSELVTVDIAFGIGPRINAAGRLTTMDVGIECLLTDSAAKAAEYAEELNNINQERKEVEQGTIEEAVEQAQSSVVSDTLTIVAHSPDWHAGVVGIVAGRIKEAQWRPTFILCSDPDTGEIKGSGRSIPGFNLKDALDQVDKAIPGVLLRFGGHAMAAGVTIAPGGVEAFKAELERQAKTHLDPALLNEEVLHDGELNTSQLNLATYYQISQIPWGQGFPAPQFKNTFTIVEAKKIGKNNDHLQLTLENGGLQFNAVKFRYPEEAPQKGAHVDAIYTMDIRRTRHGDANLQLLISHLMLDEGAD